ncbi:MAG: TRIC cation channel family protein, partial [Atopobium minutum]|nr:TRIC cation channel family protein [Atopobium minutum]
MLQIPIWLDLSAVIVGALAGVWAAQERKLDLVGYIGLSFLCGLGGGLVRDMAMQVGSVY